MKADDAMAELLKRVLGGVVEEALDKRLGALPRAEVPSDGEAPQAKLNKRQEEENAAQRQVRWVALGDTVYRFRRASEPTRAPGDRATAFFRRESDGKAWRMVRVSQVPKIPLQSMHAVDTGSGRCMFYRCTKSDEPYLGILKSQARKTIMYILVRGPEYDHAED